MIMRDILKEHLLEKVPDGMGGVAETLTPSLSFYCKVSVSNDVAKATAYGVLAEQVLDVVSVCKPRTDCLYEFNSKKYSVRKAFKKGRYVYSTLVEVK